MIKTILMKIKRNRIGNGFKQFTLLELWETPSKHKHIRFIGITLCNIVIPFVLYDNKHYTKKKIKTGYTLKRIKK